MNRFIKLFKVTIDTAYCSCDCEPLARLLAKEVSGWEEISYENYLILKQCIEKDYLIVERLPEGREEEIIRETVQEYTSRQQKRLAKEEKALAEREEKKAKQKAKRDKARLAKLKEQYEGAKV